MSQSVLLLATTTGYQVRTFGEAAARLGVRLIFATDRCDQLEDPWWDQAIPIRFHHEAESVEVIHSALRGSRIDGILVVGDRPTVIAAMVARAIGRPGHPPEAARAARDKRLMRERLRAAGLPGPWFTSVRVDADPSRLATAVSFPCVVKPTVLAGSRGVMFARDPYHLRTVVDRLRRLLSSTDVRGLRDEATETMLIEAYIEGREYAIEGVLEHGAFRTLAIFDKPDALGGPFFEETLYVTPSRAARRLQGGIEQAVVAAAAALGLHHGPVHAECRVNEDGVFVLEVAARPIGGLCARALAFERSTGERAGLEELLLRHALGESISDWVRERAASGVMMIPIPKPGVYRGVSGLEEARGVSGVEDVRITAKVDQRLVPLPEGASYLGFIFARAETPGEVESALRRAHANLGFDVDTAIAVNEGQRPG
jgi:biotin carboxylase